MAFHIKWIFSIIFLDDNILASDKNTCVITEQILEHNTESMALQSINIAQYTEH